MLPSLAFMFFLGNLFHTSKSERERFNVHVKSSPSVYTFKSTVRLKNVSGSGISTVYAGGGRKSNLLTSASNQKWYDNLGVYSTGVILTIEDVYNNFVYNHTSYPTTRGYMKDFSDYKKVTHLSDQALKYKKLSSRIKGLGNLGTGLMTIQSVNRFIDGDRTILNSTDGIVGILGLGNAFVSRWGMGSPKIGPFVAYYGAFRLLYDFCAVPNINQIHQNILSNINPLEGVYNPTLGN